MSYHQDGTSVEVFSTYHHPDHVVCDINIELEATASISMRSLTSCIEKIESVAEIARRLNGDLLNLANKVPMSDRSGVY